MVAPRKKAISKALPAVTVVPEVELPLSKAQETIAITPRPGSNLTLMTRKLSNVLLAIAQSQGDKELYTANLSRIGTTAKFNSHDTEVIKNNLRKMAETTVEWNSSGTDGRRWGIGTLLSFVEIIEDPKTRRCTIEWSYSNKIKKRMLNPEVYAKLSLQFITSLRTASAVALYEICAKYIGNPGMVTNRQAWEWWRPVLTGISDVDLKGEGGYMVYKYFKRDVLKESIKEINEITDLEVELIEHKSGRSVIDIQFRVKRKSQAGLPLEDENVLNMKLYNEIIELGLTPYDTENVIGQYAEGTVRACLDATLARAKDRTKAPLDSKAAYFRAALKRGFVQNQVLPQGAKQPALEAKASTLASEKPTKEQAIAMLISKRAQETEAAFETMDNAQEYLDRFKEEKLPSLPATVKRAFEKNGLESKIVRTNFFPWLSTQIHGDPSDTDLLHYLLG